MRRSCRLLKSKYRHIRIYWIPQCTMLKRICSSKKCHISVQLARRKTEMEGRGTWGGYRRGGFNVER